MSESPPDFVRADRGSDLVETTLDLLAYDTQNPPGTTCEIVEYLTGRFADLPVSVDRVALDPEKPNLTVTVPGEREATLLYNGHLDTVPFDPDEWSVDPLGERDGDRLYGRGATDMKGAVAAMVETISAFGHAESRPPLTLQFQFVSDEETGGRAGLDALVSSGAVEATACVIGETTCEGDRHSVTVADRGSIWLTLAATGDGAHGSRPMLGVNAIDRLWAAVEDVRELLSGYDLTYDPAVRPIVDESVEYYAPRLGAERARELFEHPTVNLGTIQGGEAINSVPAAARAELDVRLTASVDTPAVMADIRTVLADHDRVRVADTSCSIGTYEPMDSPLVDSVQSVASAVTGERVYRRSATGGGDAKTLRKVGIPTVEFALGTETAHAVDEYTTVDALVANAEVYTRLPYVLAEAMPSSVA
ncbi:M20 family metallopeptidase [Halorientalis salina]|uniref:M20 family metallopeptidase n=1 Tax=Halorientalis salina TaxID=2932266 RepID=UPI0010ABFFE8|nr:M20/M25/M40 family metallo-hydrolase [Halorientalis salina]